VRVLLNGLSVDWMFPVTSIVWQLNAGGDFGGHREASDDGDSIITASREFAEETLGLFSSTLINSDSVQASTLAMSNTLRSSDTLHVSHKLRQVCSCCPLIPSRAIRLGIEPQESLPKAPSFVFPAPGC